MIVVNDCPVALGNKVKSWAEHSRFVIRKLLDDISKGKFEFEKISENHGPDTLRSIFRAPGHKNSNKGLSLES